MIYLSKSFLGEIIKHCKEEFPNEACGILAGKNGKVEKIYRMTNVEKSPFAYLMDPKEQLKVMKEIRSLGLEMVGVYHSHVSSPPYPSLRDIEMAFYPEISWVIISLKDLNNPEIRSFRIVEGKVEEEGVDIE